MDIPKYKIAILGESRVGKTCITTRFCKGEFNENQKSTVNAYFQKRELSINENKLNLEIWVIE